MNSRFMSTRPDVISRPFPAARPLHSSGSHSSRTQHLPSAMSQRELAGEAHADDDGHSGDSRRAPSPTPGAETRGADAKPRGASAQQYGASAQRFSCPEELFRLPLAEAKKIFVQSFEKTFITAALKSHRGNVSATARSLGLHRQSLQRKLAQLQIGPHHGGTPQQSTDDSN